MTRFNRFGPTIALGIVAAFCFVLSSHASPSEGGLRGIYEQLTREQRAELHARIPELWREGSTHQEIHDKVAELIRSHGIDMSDNHWRIHKNRGDIPRFGHGPDHIMQDLTNEQRAQVRGQMIELWSEGAGPEEIHDAVAELLKVYGVEVPEHAGFGRGKHGFGHEPGRFMQGLTTEQRAEIRVRMMELWTGGSTHEEIRTAVDEQLESYGIDLAENERGAVSGEESGGVPADLRLDIEASPNPFEKQTNISYNLPIQTNVRVMVYDMDGQVIRSFDMGQQTAGSHRVVWDGADEIGNRVMNGPYLCRIHAGEFTATSRVMVIR